MRKAASLEIDIFNGIQWGKYSGANLRNRQPREFCNTKIQIPVFLVSLRINCYLSLTFLETNLNQYGRLDVLSV